jgi:hypothetical protein
VRKLAALLLSILAAGSAPAADLPPQSPLGAVEILPPSSSGARAAVLASSRDGGVWLAWIEPAGSPQAGPALRCARFDAVAGCWGASQTIASVPGWEDGEDIPAFAAGARGHLAAAWPVRRPEPIVLASQSDDNGATWTPPAPLSRESHHTSHVCLATLEDGRVLAAWLDGRAPRLRAGFAALYLRFLTGPMTVAPDWLFEKAVSGSCQPDLEPLLDGGALLAYRALSSDGERDIAVARLHGRRWDDRHVLSPDGWIAPSEAQTFGGGPAVATDGNRAVAAWYTEADGDPRILVSTSPDAGARFLMPLRLDAGRPAGHPAAALLHDGAALVTWMSAESGADPDTVWLRRLSPENSLDPALSLGKAAPARIGGSPRIALVRDYAGGAEPAQAMIAFTGPEKSFHALLVTVPEASLLAAAEQNCRCGLTPAQLLGYPVSGTIAAVSPAYGTVVMDTGAIPGLIDAGRHVFFASDAQSRTLDAGRKYVARLEYRDGMWWLYDAKLLDEAR